MAHYDCSNCGEDMGVGYGYCENCTPEKVFSLESKIRGRVRKALDEFEEADREKLSLLEKHLKLSKRKITIKALRQRFVEEKIEKLIEQYVEAYQSGVSYKVNKKSVVYGLKHGINVDFSGENPPFANLYRS